jgi:hypothetical protein
MKALSMIDKIRKHKHQTEQDIKDLTLEGKVDGGMIEEYKTIASNQIKEIETMQS